MASQLIFIVVRLSFFLLATGRGETGIVNGWTIAHMLSRHRHHQHRTPVHAKSIARSKEEPNSKNNEEVVVKYNAEVVGAFGRMGSFWLCHHNDDNDAGSEVGVPAIVPRGISPGYLSPFGCPIYIAIPSQFWVEIYNQVPDDRRCDCVFIGNGIPLSELKDATIVVPHYGILQVCRLGKDDNDHVQKPIVTSPLSPKTYIYHRGANSKHHAMHVSKILNRQDVSTQSVDADFQKIQTLAGQKLLWASCMWLVCHYVDDDTTATENNNSSHYPLTVSQAHEQRQRMIDQLVEELLPAFQKMNMGQSLSKDEVLQYIKSYSLSMPTAIPSKQLALAELNERNGVWLKLATTEKPQTFHKQLIQQHIPEVFNMNFSEDQGVRHDDMIDSTEWLKLDMDHIHLTAWGRRRRQQDSNLTAAAIKPKHISIVGGGIMGSAISLFLAQRHPNCTIAVFDHNKDNGSSLGKTTPASWAWLNANGKSPKSYQLLNLLGIHAWKHESHLSALPAWMGSLVRFENFPDFVNDGGLPIQGPLSNDQIQEIEPLCDWKLTNKQDDGDGVDTSGEGFTFHFPDEGCVDPAEAVQILRQAAKTLGVKFYNDRNVTNVVKDLETGKVSGIMTSSDIDGEEFVATDLVVSAAGTGVSSSHLGGMPLQHRPGQIAYAHPSDESQNSGDRLSKLLVDSARQIHLLQRKDGSLVAGGGALEVGGVEFGSSSEEESTSTTTKTASATTNKNDDDGDTFLLDGAKKLAPALMSSAKFSHTASAVRPMTSDGLPAIGYIDQGLYVVVTHSGITLGPLLAALAAGEIMENIECDILSEYRPTRFFSREAGQRLK